MKLQQGAKSQGSGECHHFSTAQIAIKVPNNTWFNCSYITTDRSYPAGNGQDFTFITDNNLDFKSLRNSMNVQILTICTFNLNFHLNVFKHCFGGRKKRTAVLHK